MLVKLNKTILIIILFYFLFLRVSIGQTSIYHPFPDSNAIWRVDKYDSSYPLGTAFSTYQIYLEGDTTATSGLIYHKLIIEGNFEINTPDYRFGKGLFGVLWQDTIAKKVYYKGRFDINSTNFDSLLYDFNMQVGDKVVNNFNFRQSGDTLMVHSIDSILINGSYRKKFNISYLDSQLTGVIIIEGIGSTLGGYYQYEFFEQFYELMCFKKDGITIYPNNHNFCLTINASVEDNLIQDESIDIYPIPVMDYFIIQADENIRYLEIHNLYGDQIYNYKFIDGIHKKILIDSSVPNGAYTLVFEINNLVFTRLIIIIR